MDDGSGGGGGEGSQKRMREDGRQTSYYIFSLPRTSAITSLFVLGGRKGRVEGSGKNNASEVSFYHIFNRIFVFILVYVIIHSYRILQTAFLFFFFICSFLIFPLHVSGIFILFPSTFLYSSQSL